MLLDAGHILTGKKSRQMKVCAFVVNKKVHAALKIVADRKRLSMSHIARGWLQSVVRNHKTKAFDLRSFKAACEDLPGGATTCLSLPLSNELIRQLNRLADELGCKIGGIVNVAVVLGLRQFAKHYAEPSLRAEIERALFGERSAAESLENKEGNSVAAA